MHAIHQDIFCKNVLFSKFCPIWNWVDRVHAMIKNCCLYNVTNLHKILMIPC